MFKKINFKSILIGIIIGIVLSSSVFAGEEIMQYIFTPSSAKLLIDDVEYSNPDIPQNLFLYQDRNYAPMAIIRDICNKLSIPFVYDNATKEIRITTTGVTSITTNTTGKEESALMSEVVATTIDPVTSYEEDNILIVEFEGVKYVEIHSLKTQLESLGYNLYLGGIHITLQDKNSKNLSENIMIQEEFRLKARKQSSFDFMRKEFILYSDYINKIKPSIGE
jgi:hypothetical protein